MGRVIIYGDIHGCYNEFVALRKKIGIQKDDMEVCVGDIITKGKESIKTLDYIIENSIKSVLGNHEDKLLRYIKHQKSDKKNPIILDDDEHSIIDSFSKKQIVFLKNLPLYIKIGTLTILHGGLQNSIDLNNMSKRDREKILRLRYLDKNKNFLMYGKEDKTSQFCANAYNGTQGFIIYGHSWSKEVKKSRFTLGIDTGCVYGNRLTAVVFNSPENFKIVSQNSMG